MYPKSQPSNTYNF